MNDSGKSLIINLIYVKGSVKKLIPLLKRNLAKTGCCYRLISNGCSVEEDHYLQRFAKNQSRLHFYKLDTSKILPHHEVLNELLRMDNDEYFAFMDTDIVALNDPIPEIIAKLEKHDGFTSGLPVWHEDEDLVIRENFRVVGGRFAEVHTGDIVGLSYFGIYRRKALLEFIETSGIDFNRYKWKEIPSIYKRKLKGWGLKKSYFDTGKLLVLLWNKSGGKVTYSPIKEMVHFGGISGKQHQNSRSFVVKKIINLTPDFLKFYSRYFIFMYKLGFISIKEYVDLLRLIEKRTEVFSVLNHFQNGSTSDLSDSDFKTIGKERLADLSLILKDIYR